MANTRKSTKSDGSDLRQTTNLQVQFGHGEEDETERIGSALRVALCPAQQFTLGRAKRGAGIRRVSKGCSSESHTQSSAASSFFHIAFDSPSGSRGTVYLSFCSLALLLRHSPRHKESISSIPIITTPSFMPNQMESNVSTVHLSQRAARHLVSDADLPLNTSIMSVRFGKRDGT